MIRAGPRRDLAAPRAAPPLLPSGLVPGPESTRDDPPRPTPVEVLVRFARSAAGGDDPDLPLRALVDAALEHLGAAAAGVFRLEPAPPRLVASRNLPAGLEGAARDGLEGLIAAARAACGDAFGALDLLPLAGLDGQPRAALLLARASAAQWEPDRSELARGLTGLAATALHCAERLQGELRVRAELGGSARTLAQGALAELGPRVAQDLSRVLGPLAVDVEELRAGAASPERVREATERMSSRLKAGRELLTRLRGFARQEPEHFHPLVDPGAAIRAAAEGCQAQGRARGVEVRVRLAPLSPLPVSSSDLAAALGTLIQNGIEAQPRGGAVEVQAGTAPGGRVWIEVADAGPGVPAALHPRLFEPFMSEREAPGAGLGLANVYAFARRHQGTVELMRADGTGSTFRLELPAQRS